MRPLATNSVASCLFACVAVDERCVDADEEHGGVVMSVVGRVVGRQVPAGVHRRAALRARRVHDRLQTRDLALGRRQVQSGASLADGGGEVGAGDEVADDGGVAPGGGRVQRGVVGGVAGPRVGAGRQQEARVEAAGSRVVQGRLLLETGRVHVASCRAFQFGRKCFDSIRFDSPI